MKEQEEREDKRTRERPWRGPSISSVPERLDLPVELVSPTAYRGKKRPTPIGATPRGTGVFRLDGQTHTDRHTQICRLWTPLGILAGGAERLWERQRALFLQNTSWTCHRRQTNSKGAPLRPLLPQRQRQRPRLHRQHTRQPAARRPTRRRRRRQQQQLPNRTLPQSTLLQSTRQAPSSCNSKRHEHRRLLPAPATPTCRST